jgi:hypothetical protein
LKAEHFGLSQLSRSGALSTLMLFGGATIMTLIIIQSPPEKIAIVVSSFSLFVMLAAVHMVQNGRSASIRSRAWLVPLPLMIAIWVNLLAVLAPRAIAAFLFAGAVAVIFVLSRVTDVSKAYLAVMMAVVAASIGYNVFLYYPLVGGDPDPLGYLSVASGIVQTGHYFGFTHPTDTYYFPFPVMSIAPSMLHLASELDLQTSLLVFPGILVLLQPLLVFLLSRLLFDNPEAAALSALILVTEATVTRFINQPLAQPIAVSMLLIVLIALLRPGRSRGHIVVAFTTFLMVVVLHAAVAIVSIILMVLLLANSRRPSPRRIPLASLSAILLGYLLTAGLIDRIVYKVDFEWNVILEFISGRTIGTIQSYGASTSGIVFVWWGLPPSLALFWILLERGRREIFWAYAGLGLLGLSFAVNVVAPSLTMDRYVGLMAWVILAVIGGRALSRISGTFRKVLILAPIIFLVVLSSILNPYVSPQYGYTYQVTLPTTNADRIALDWTDIHATGAVVSDYNSAWYSVFSRYRSGMLSSRGIISCHECLRNEMINLPTRNNALFVRWSDTFVGLDRNQSCHGLGSGLANGQGNRVVNILYHNSCDALGADPSWR